MKCMKIDELGQVTIPQNIRDQFGFGPQTEVLRKAPAKLDLANWKDSESAIFTELGYTSVDDFIEDVRGR